MRYQKKETIYASTNMIRTSTTALNVFITNYQWYYNIATNGVKRYHGYMLSRKHIQKYSNKCGAIPEFLQRDTEIPSKNLRSHGLLFSKKIIRLKK